MDKDSKRRNEAIKRLKPKLYNFPVDTVEKIAQLPTDYKFPPSVAVNAEIEEETKKFVLRFDFLDWETCNFEQFDQTKARTLIKKFQYITSLQVNQLSSSGIVRDSVKDTKEYRSLFEHLSPDIDLKETELSEGGRIFFFIVEESFYIVSIETKHRNID